MNRRLYRVPEAAAEMNISPKTLWNWIAQARIGVIRLGGHSVRIPHSEVERLIEEGFSPARQSV